MWVSLRLLLHRLAPRHAARRRGRRVRRGQAVPVRRSRADGVLVRHRCRSRSSCSPCCSRTPASGSTTLLGFTGETKLLYTTGEITPGPRPVVVGGPRQPARASGAAVARADRGGAWRSTAATSATRCSTCSAATSCARRAPRGCAASQALIKHGLRTALIPMATFFAYEFALLFVGATFTEKIFGWHGMGEYFVDSVTKNDVNSVAGRHAVRRRARADRRLPVGRRLRRARSAGPGVSVTARATAAHPQRRAAAATRRRRVAMRAGRAPLPAAAAGHARRRGRRAAVRARLPEPATSRRGSTTSSTRRAFSRRRRPRTGSAPRRTASTCSR